MDKDLELLHQKIDFLTEQVLLTQKKQRAFEELAKDLTPIANDLFKTAVEELDQVAPYFSYEDLIFLAKKILRNIRTLTAMFDNLESAVDFAHDAAPLSKAVFQSTLEQLNDLEHKGYFTFFKSALAVADRIVTAFTKEDIKQLGENIVLILNTVKQLTQPQMLTLVQNALNVYQNINVNPPENVSLWTLLKELQSPEVRRGILTGLTILKNLSGTMNAPQEVLTTGKAESI